MVDVVLSGKNRDAHGIDFVEAQGLWDDPDLLAVPAKVAGEERWVLTGAIGGMLFSALVVPCGEKIRILAVRPASREEGEVYES